jgi:hypothetical protein
MKVPLFVIDGTEAPSGGPQVVVTKIAETLTASRDLHLQIDSSQRYGGSFKAHYKLSAPRPGHFLNLAVAESGVISEVMAGNNAGQTLTHQNLVRSFVTMTLGEEASGEAEISFPPDVVAENCRLIAYVQDPESMQIEAANQFR